MSISARHLLDTASLSVEDLTRILDLAEYYDQRGAEGRINSDRLAGRVILTLFMEPSTRTRMSFAMAAHRLGASVIDWTPESSSMTKGESFEDTLTTLNEMRPDAVVLRHADHGAPLKAAELLSCPVINAGDSWRAHPSQALLDALTIRQTKGRIEGLTVAICGDITHSRVASCNISLLTRMGAKVRLIGPQALLPSTPQPEGVSLHTSMESGLPGADIVMMLRVQKERMAQSDIPDAAAYFREWGLTQERLALAGPEAFVMHPQPMNRGVEIADDVADDPKRSLLRLQVRNGVPVRMAIFDLLMDRRATQSRSLSA